MMNDSKVESIVAYLDARILSQQTVDNVDEKPDLIKERGVVAEYNLRLMSLVMIKQLMHLCRDIQKHRGLGMALLAGNQEFAPRFIVLQKQMARRIHLLSAFCLEESNPFSETEVNKIYEAWNTIHEGWHDDSVIENFQFHSYFVEQLLQMVMQLAQRLPFVSFSFIDQLNIETTESKVEDELLVFICSQLPKMIEYLGMVRALASHSATIGHNIVEHDKKLKYLCRCVQLEKMQVIGVAEKLHQLMGSDIPSLLVLQTYAFKVDAFIDKVMNQVIGQEKIAVSSDELFTMATEIMDVYWRVVDDGIDVLHHAQDKSLERWCLDF